MMQLSLLAQELETLFPIFSLHESDAFCQHVKEFYTSHRRDFAWRNTFDPYHIVVSEIMLQQTQTERVVQKFPEFVGVFKDFASLAQASTREVITAWQGLGYNRRALALQAIAITITKQYDGILPANPELLQTFKGIGPNTASSICAFAFNMPTIFIETNIRTVFIYSFFNDRTDIPDQDILPVITQVLDRENPREWYYALMDYGVALKKKFNNPSRKSKHHTIQSKFEGSERQIRGMILRVLTTHQALNFELLCTLIDREPYRIKRNLTELISEGFIIQNRDIFYIA